MGSEGVTWASPGVGGHKVSEGAQERRREAAWKAERKQEMG